MIRDLTSRGSSEFDDRQLPSALVKPNDQLGAKNLLCLGFCLFDCRSLLENLVGSSTIETLMGPKLGEPCEIQSDFASHILTPQWNKDAPQPFIFERKEKALDDGGCPTDPIRVCEGE